MARRGLVIAVDGVTARPEEARDIEAISQVNAAAFGQPAEARLVRELRAAGAVTLSLVADNAGRVVGHILFSPVTIETPDGPVSAVGLAPMAVLPADQRAGIGSLLVREGLEALRGLGHEIVVVLGHPDYYPRFGFAPARDLGLRWEHDCPDEAFMALELRPGAFTAASGIVRYHPAFDGV